MTKFNFFLDLCHFSCLGQFFFLQKFIYMDQNIQNNQSGIPPKNYLVESILVTLFCCLPLGIAGIVNASKVEGLYRSGDIAGANNASANAKKWSLYGAIAGGVVILLYIILFMIMGIGAATANV